MPFHARHRTGQGGEIVPFRSVTHGGVTLLCFPPHDVVFARVAMAHLAAISASKPGPTPARLEAALRDRFPRTIVRPRATLAELMPGEAWYVYRDGRYSPFADQDPWWELPETAWLEIGDDGRYLDANDAALAIMGVERSSLGELVTGDLADAPVRSLVPWVWELARETGILQSTSILRPRDGRPPVGIEYRLVRLGDGRWRSSMRVIPREDAGVTPDEAGVSPADAGVPPEDGCVTPEVAAPDASPS